MSTPGRGRTPRAGGAGDQWPCGDPAVRREVGGRRPQEPRVSGAASRRRWSPARVPRLSPARRPPSPGHGACHWPCSSHQLSWASRRRRGAGQRIEPRVRTQAASAGGPAAASPPGSRAESKRRRKNPPRLRTLAGAAPQTRVSGPAPGRPLPAGGSMIPRPGKWPSRPERRAGLGSCSGGPPPHTPTPTPQGGRLRYRWSSLPSWEQRIAMGGKAGTGPGVGGLLRPTSRCGRCSPWPTGGRGLSPWAHSTC